LISNGLVPLKTSLKKAEIRLSHYQRDDMQLFCHVVGTNTLIAGYAYLGQTVPTLQKDLENSIYVFQKRLLDSIAKSNHEIPWNRVPYLLTTDGVSELVELYNSTKSKVEKTSPTESPSTQKNIDLENASHTVQKETVTKRKVREMNLQEVAGTARVLHDFLYLNLSCSECGFKGFPQNATECPNCNRKFVK
jgi:hypothetical protein